MGELEQMAKGGLGVDPEGLFKNAGMPSGGHFARRDAMKAAAAAPPPPVRQCHCRPKPRPLVARACLHDNCMIA